MNTPSFLNCVGQQISLTALQQAVTKLDRNQKLALATFLTGTSNPKYPPKFLATPKLEDVLELELVEACHLIAELDCPHNLKIFWAIELLTENCEKFEDYSIFEKQKPQNDSS